MILPFLSPKPTRVTEKQTQHGVLLNNNPLSPIFREGKVSKSKREYNYRDNFFEGPVGEWKRSMLPERLETGSLGDKKCLIVITVMVNKQTANLAHSPKM